MIYATPVNFEEELAALDFEPLYLDDFDSHIEEDRDRLNELLYTRYDRNDSLNNIPSCACGTLFGKAKEGRRCVECGHECKPVYTRSIEPVLWVRVPDGITYFVNPLIWSMLSNILKSRSNSILLWLTDPKYRPVQPQDPKMNRIKELYDAIPGFERGINFFTEHFGEILSTIYQRKILNHRWLKRTGILELWETHGEAFFTTVLPIPNRNTVVIEQNGTVIDADTQALSGIDVFLTINNMHHRRLMSSIPVKESEIARCQARLAQYYETYFTEKLLRKSGKIRKHVVGSRLNFTARAVISSLHGVHHHEELHIPWGLAVELFKEHIRAYLLHHEHLSPREVVNIQMQHVQSYHPLLDKALMYLIGSTPYTDMEGNKLGYPCLLGRNPTLRRGSIQMFYISKIKKEIDKFGRFSDNTISLSPLAINDANSDYDGDELNMTLCLDREMFNQFSRLEPHLSVLDLGKPWAISKHVGMPNSQLATLGNFLHITD